MTNNKELLDEVSECQYSIKLADNNKLSIRNNGNLITKIGERKIEIKNILCSNEVRNNLLALLDILKNDLITIMYEDLYTKNLFNLIIMDKRDYKIIYKLQTDDFKRLFTTNLPNLRNKNKEIKAILEKNFKNQIEEKFFEKLIHLSFGHISSKLISPIKENIDLEKCKGCIMSKMTRDAFPENKKRQDKPFSLIHADLIGPFNQESRNGYKYVLVLLDDHSRFSWIYLLKEKSETYDHYIIFVKMIIKKYNKEITFLHTDNGKEFDNENFRVFNEINQITHLKTIPYSSQMNGRVERLNRWLQQIMRSLLITSKMPTVFWEDALLYACYLSNIVPHSAINNEIPYEIINKKKPDYNILRIWGCLVKYLILNKKIRDKERTRNGIFIG